MSREIKFRGKRIDNGEWAYGYYAVHKMMITGEMDYFIIVNEQRPQSVDPKTVGQYTGLKDKNGKEIYEGDILQDQDGIGEIEWVQEHCAFLIFTRNPSIYHKIESDGTLTNTLIIGNIYTDPELLEEAK